MQDNFLKKIIYNRKKGIKSGIASFCSANRYVIEAALEQAKKDDAPILIESTSNQVNQFGGYLGMNPSEFRNYVYEIADKVGFDKDKIILGGDHLGPEPWKGLNEKEALENSKELVRQCVLAGYIKIHLDTSMKVADDDKDSRLSDCVIARRGAIMLKEAEKAYLELLKSNPDAPHPVYVIGSEVPIPGGAQNDTEKLEVTSPIDFKNTVNTYKKLFAEMGILDKWEYVIAVVVQPGVEFGDDEIHPYNREEAKDLVNELKKYPNLVFEGHSTDYQSSVKLKEMVEDGIAILKVGPALTLAFREALFALSYIEKELIEEEQRANFIEILEEEMVKDPKDWKKYYHGSEKDLYIARKYSFSDRCRYYFSKPRVDEAIEKLLANLEKVDIPLSMIHEYLPLSYIKIRDGVLTNNPRSLVKDNIVNVIDDYNYATKHN